MMANEITKRITLALVNGIDKLTNDRGNKQATQATAQPAVRMAQSTQNVTTSDAALTLPGVAAGNLGEALFENMDTDPTHYLDIGPESGGAIVKMFRLYGGQQASMMLIPSTTYRGQANSVTQVLAITLLAK